MLNLFVPRCNMSLKCFLSAIDSPSACRSFPDSLTPVENSLVNVSVMVASTRRCRSPVIHNKRTATNIDVKCWNCHVLLFPNHDSIILWNNACILFVQFFKSNNPMLIWDFFFVCVWWSIAGVRSPTAPPLTRVSPPTSALKHLLP